MTTTTVYRPSGSRSSNSEANRVIDNLKTPFVSTTAGLADSSTKVGRHFLWGWRKQARLSCLSERPECTVQSNLERRRRGPILQVGSLPGTGSREVLFGSTMSPLVQRQRVKGPQVKRGTDQHWSMLVFESFSAGVMAVLVGLLAVMVLVGVYVILVWPLTFWNLTNSGLEKYGAWVNTVLWSVFAGGSLAGCWFFSGAAFKSKKSPKASSVTVRGKSSRA